MLVFKKIAFSKFFQQTRILNSMISQKIAELEMPRANEMLKI